MDNTTILTAKILTNKINSLLSDAKIKNIKVDKDKYLLNTFAKLLPYYYCLSSDLPTDIKFILFLNKWHNVCHACMDIPKLFSDQRLARLTSKAVTHIQAYPW